MSWGCCWGLLLHQTKEDRICTGGKYLRLRGTSELASHCCELLILLLDNGLEALDGEPLLADGISSRGELPFHVSNRRGSLLPRDPLSSPELRTKITDVLVPHDETLLHFSSLEAIIRSIRVWLELLLVVLRRELGVGDLHCDE